MSESFLNRILLNTGWGLWLTSLIPASRWGFGLGTIVVNIMVFGGSLLIATQALPLSSKPIALTGLVAQMALIRKRESDIHPKRRWRFGYAAAFAVLAFIWMVSPMGIGIRDEDRRIEVISAVVMGGFLMLQILILPVTVSCCVRKAPLPP